MKKSLLAGLLIVLISGCAKSPQEKIFELFQEGVHQIDQYDFDAALATFKKIGEIDPSTPLSFYGTGLVFERQLQYYNALHVYLAITNTKPTFAPALAGTWRIFTHLERWEDALQAAAEYSRLLPDDAEAKLTLAEALINVNQSPRARQELNKALDAGAEPAIYNLAIAKSYQSEHQGDSALAHLKKAMSAQKKSPEFYARAASYFEAAGLIDSAITMGRVSLESSKTDFKLVIDHFYRALKLHHFFDARQVMHKLKADGAPELILTGLEMFYYTAEGSQTYARHACDAYGRISGHTISALFFDMAVRGKDSDILTATQNTAAIDHAMQTGNYDQEFQEYMKYSMAVLFGGYYNDLEGLTELQKVPAMFSNRKEVRLRKAYIFYRTGQPEKFEQEMALLSKFHSSSPDWLTGLADIYADKSVRRYNEAAEYFQQALKYNKWYRPAFENVVTMYRRLNQAEKALEIFSAYPHFEQQYPEISILKAMCLIEINSISEGVDLFEASFALVKGNLSTFVQVAELLNKKDRQQEEAKLYRLLPQMSPHNVDALLLAAQFESDQEEFTSALSLAEQALSVEPDNVSATVQKARALYGLEKRSEAFDIFEKNLREFRFNVDNNHYFSKILATEQIDLKRAANLARRAVFDSHHDLKVWMNLSYVYFQKGRYDLSRGEALKASQSHMNEPEPYFWMGMAMYKEGKEEAKENLEKAVALGLKGENLNIARRTLEKL